MNASQAALAGRLGFILIAFALVTFFSSDALIPIVTSHQAKRTFESKIPPQVPLKVQIKKA